MASRGVERLALARRRPVAKTIIGRAEMRPALYYPPHAEPAWDAARLVCAFGAGRRKQARGPLPHIANHVVKPIAVGGKSPDRRGTLVSIDLEVLPGKPALPRIGHH